MTQGDFVSLKLILPDHIGTHLKALAAIHRLSTSSLIRTLLQTSCVEAPTEDEGALAWRKVIRSTIAPLTDVLAKRAAQAAIASATAMYLGVECADDLGIADAHGIFDQVSAIVATTDDEGV